MELSILLIVGMCCSVQADLDADDFAEFATKLHVKLGNLLVQFNQFQTVVNNSLVNVQPIDFGIKTNSQVGQLENVLTQKESKSAIPNCQLKFKNGKESAQKVLQDIVITKLKEQSSNLNQYVANLTYIQNRLIGKALREELSKCPDCKILYEYHNAAYNTENFVKDHMTELTSPQLPMLYAKMYADPVIDKTINEEILNPVNSCLGKLH